MLKGLVGLQLLKKRNRYLLRDSSGQSSRGRICQKGARDRTRRNCTLSKRGPSETRRFVNCPPKSRKTFLMQSGAEPPEAAQPTRESRRRLCLRALPISIIGGITMQETTVIEQDQPVGAILSPVPAPAPTMTLCAYGTKRPGRNLPEWRRQRPQQPINPFPISRWWRS